MKDPSLFFLSVMGDRHRRIMKVEDGFGYKSGLNH